MIETRGSSDRSPGEPLVNQKPSIPLPEGWSARVQRAMVSFQEGSPRSRAIRSVLKSVLFECLGNRTASDSMTDVCEFSLDSTVAAARVLDGHPNDERSDLLHDPGAPNASLGGVGPLRCDEAAMPCENGVGGDKWWRTLEGASGRGSCPSPRVVDVGHRSVAAAFLGAAP